MGWFHGVVLKDTPTNLFGKNRCKETLATIHAMTKEYAQEILSLKESMAELTTRIEAMEK